MRIKNLNNILLLQSDLDQLVHWGKSLILSLKVSKYLKIYYFHIAHSIIIYYTIHGILITSSNSVHDLDFHFLSNLFLKQLHVQKVSCRALKILDFIRCIYSEFKLYRSLKLLYCSHVHPILEYRSVLWESQLFIDSITSSAQISIFCLFERSLILFMTNLRSLNV